MKSHLPHPSDHPWRIDAQVAPFSRWWIFILLVWSTTLLVLASLASLFWWQWLLLLAVTILSSWLFFWQRLPVAHITQPAFGQSESNAYDLPWFIYILDDTHEQKDKDPQQNLQLWQGYLTDTHVNRYLVVLRFDVIEPWEREISVVIWRDQVSPLAWRQLQVLTRL